MKIYQRFYIRALFKFRDSVDKFTAVNNFKQKFGNIKFLLTDNDINQEKSKAIINKENKTLEDQIKNLEDYNEKL